MPVQPILLYLMATGICTGSYLLYTTFTQGDGLWCIEKFFIQGLVCNGILPTPNQLWPQCSLSLSNSEEDTLTGVDLHADKGCMYP